MTDNKKSNQHIDNMVSPSSEQTSKLERIDRHYFTQQVQQVFNVDRGILYTTKEFLIRPGKSIQEFLFENRDKHVKPVFFLIFTSIIFSLISYFLNIEYSYFNVNEIQVLQDKINTGDFGEWLNNNIGYTNLIIGIFIALWIRVFVRNYNIFEIIVMLCYILGIMTLILSLAFVIGKVANNGFIVLGVMLIFFLYPIWAIGQFFGKKKFVSYIKSLVVMILGYTSYFFVFILIGYLLNILQN
jgi:hypothetical protein